MSQMAGTTTSADVKIVAQIAIPVHPNPRVANAKTMAEASASCDEKQLSEMAAFYHMQAPATLAGWKLYHRLKSVPQLSHVTWPNEKSVETEYCIQITAPGMDRPLAIQNSADDEYSVCFLDKKTCSPIEETVVCDGFEKLVAVLTKLTIPVTIRAVRVLEDVSRSEADRIQQALMILKEGKLPPL